MRAYEEGLDAESFVAAFLEEDGWRVLARNWRGGGAELDLVVQRDGCVRVVEVKARQPGEDGLEAITADKQSRLRRGAEAWLAQHPAPVEVAFLIALVTLEDALWSIELWDDPF